jgi:hypothetical protein
MLSDPKRLLIQLLIVAVGKHRSLFGSRSWWRAKQQAGETGEAPRTDAIISRRSHA